MREIYYIVQDVLNDKELFTHQIRENITNNYYWSDDWSENFYINLAKAGFISTTYDTKEGLVLLPELQYAYALLDFKDLHISEKVKKLLKKQNYTFTINTKFDEVLDAISKTHKYNWLKDKYIEVMKNIYTKNSFENFKLVSVELCDKETNELISGEIGYIIGETYTSLTGFSSREKVHNNYGTLQLVLLAKYLQERKFSFWNLGHPHMEYKKRLGAKVYKRKDFLQRWDKATLLPTINLI